MRIFLDKPYLLALIISTALTLWLLSGPPPEVTTHAKPTTATPKAVPMTVQVREQQAESLTREVILTGRTAPLRTVTLRAELNAKVSEVGAARGARVKPGDLIIRLATEDRQLRLTEAEALVKQRQAEYTAKQSLSQKGYQAQTQIAEALTLLEVAQTQVAQAKLALENTILRAPFAAVLVQRPVEQGDYVSVGTPVAELMDEDPFLVIGEVSELQRPYLSLGNSATAQLITGQTVTGRLTLISQRADPATRTFTIEIEVPNADGRLAAGITTEIRIPTTQIFAHKVSAALLSLNDEGLLGVKTVSSDNHVIFYPAKLARATADHLWLSDLPNTIRFITVGQGFVRPGDLVRPVLDSEIRPQTLK